MPRHSFDLRLLASVFETGIEIDERFSCFLVVEDELVLLPQSPEIQNPAHFRVDRNDAGLLGFRREHVNQTSVQVHVLPAEGENLPDATSRIQSVKNDILNCGCGIPQQPGFLVWLQDPKARVDLLKELHLSKRVRAQVKIPVDGEIEHMLEQRQFAIYGRTGHLLAPPKFETFDLGRRDVGQLPLDPKKLLQRLEQLLVSQPGTLVRLRISGISNRFPAIATTSWDPTARRRASLFEGAHTAATATTSSPRQRTIRRKTIYWNSGSVAGNSVR